MIKHISQSDFLDAFYNRSWGDNFSYDALCALYDYFEQYEADTGEQIELDVIAICCDWSEASEAELRQDYNIDETVSVSDYLENNTCSIPLNNGNFLYIAF